MSRGAATRVMAVALLLSLGTTVHAQRAVDLDAVTITELNAAFDAGTLTSVQLVSRYLARIAAYDRQGPAVHAVIALNPKALETARALDAERKTKGKRSPLRCHAKATATAALTPSLLPPRCPPPPWAGRQRAESAKTRECTNIST